MRELFVGFKVLQIGCNFGSSVCVEVCECVRGYVWTRLPATNDAQKSYAVTSLGILAVPHHLYPRRTSSMAHTSTQTLKQLRIKRIEQASEQAWERERDAVPPYMLSI